MADVRVLVLLVSSFVCVHGGVMSGKAIYCRDPDTGKLYSVNSTWASSSFCGNYTCNLRKRNMSEVDLPIRQLVVTGIVDMKADNDKKTIVIENKIRPDIAPMLHKSSVPEIKNMVIRNNINLISKSIDETIQPVQGYLKLKPAEPNYRGETFTEQPPDENDKDRYLTEKEINHIAEVLHTVKKSDLDAIVDIYNLVQDIYTGVDKMTNEDIVEEAINLIKEEEKHRLSPKPTSYWYDTLGNRGKMADRYDMNLQATHIIHTTMKPKTNVPPFYGALTSTEFSKLPYYYPITDFQRMASYTHASQSPSQATTHAQKETILNTDTNPCTNKQVKIKQKEVNRQDSQKLIQPSHFLPYPFASIHQYNSSDLHSNFHYNSNPWSLDYYNKYKYYQPYYNAYLYPVPKKHLGNTPKSKEVHQISIDAVPKAILVNPHLSEVQGIEQKPVKLVNDKYLLDTLLRKHHDLPDWKTDPISVETLKDIRANVDTTKIIKAFPLRKKVKLERVGKLISLDDMHKTIDRLKRLASNEEKQNDTESVDEDTSIDFGEFETYLERVTCTTLTVPGFFRIGNMTQPYPGCCPQLIKNR